MTASRMLTAASSIVSPCESTPGRSGESAPASRPGYSFNEVKL